MCPPVIGAPSIDVTKPAFGKICIWPWTKSALNKIFNWQNLFLKGQAWYKYISTLLPAPERFSSHVITPSFIYSTGFSHPSLPNDFRPGSKLHLLLYYCSLSLLLVTMTTPTRKIPKHEWELHRETIQRLYQPGSGNTLDNLVKTMKEQHGFHSRYFAH